MPWQDLLSPAQRAQVLALPTSLREYEELYTLTPADLEFVAAHRTRPNRLGVAMQLCFLRYPGRAWTPEEIVPAAMLRFIALQVEADPADLPRYAERDQTRREHAVEVMREYGFTRIRRQGVPDVIDLADRAGPWHRQRCGAGHPARPLRFGVAGSWCPRCPWSNAWRSPAAPEQDAKPTPPSPPISRPSNA